MDFLGGASPFESVSLYLLLNLGSFQQYFFEYSLSHLLGLFSPLLRLQWYKSCLFCFCPQVAESVHFISNLFFACCSGRADFSWSVQKKKVYRFYFLSFPFNIESFQHILKFCYWLFQFYTFHLVLFNVMLLYWDFSNFSFVSRKYIFAYWTNHFYDNCFKILTS